MKLFYSPRYHINIGDHVFPTIKYQKIQARLIKDGVAKEADFVEPGMAQDADILLAHTPQYLEKLKTGSFTQQEIATMEIPYMKEFFAVLQICAKGTILTCKTALETGIGIHIGGGFHHAFPDHGEGFCIINDIAIGILRCIQDGDIKRAMVIDGDLHQGNGTAVIFQRNQNVFTFSIHEENIYPMKEKSNLDIGFGDFIGDEEYLSHLTGNIPRILDDFKPELVVYVAGADPYKEDQLGSLELTFEGLKRRDKIVIGEARSRKIPIATVFGGGYAPNVEDTVTIHTNTIKAALGYSLQ
ncbi:MAG: histone deacetylase [Candidatus Saganbacteria bacterium]|nr:histone deacetylase [Candidatus Saganbacteria bacterium]